MITRQSTMHGKYHGNTGYLLRNVVVGTQEFAGMGNCVNDGQMRWTDESQMMTSCRSRTSQLHKRIAQNKMMSHPRIEMTNDALRCSTATQVHIDTIPTKNG